jgi:hypothetical protein
MRAEAHGRLDQLLRQLTPRERTAITLRDLEGLPAEEVAKEMGCSKAEPALTSGGKIGIEGMPDQGTTVSVEIPLDAQVSGIPSGGNPAPSAGAIGPVESRLDRINP